MERDKEPLSAIMLTLGAYILWGILPVYWKLLETVPATEILSHRIFWSFVFMALLVIARGPGGGFLREIKRLAGQKWRIFCVLAGAALISCNWLTYIWAVNDGRVLETSLGYYITPLTSILIGVFFLKEPLRFWQKAAVILAAVGVLNLAISYGRLPWVSLVLAATMSFYGLCKKMAALSAIAGMALETALSTPLALLYLAYLHRLGQGRFFDFSPITWILIGTGVITVIPLLMFTRGLNQLSLTTMGLLQYSAPTITFILGVFVFKEPFTRANLITFICIWLAVIVFTLSGTPLFLKGEKWLRAAFRRPPNVAG